MITLFGAFLAHPRSIGTFSVIRFAVLLTLQYCKTSIQSARRVVTALGK